ncbi:MAG TPA: substrate-binding domain-containing protein, partial [Bryobacteraceae bacterium]
VALGHIDFAFIGHHAVLGPIDERWRALNDQIKVASPKARMRVFAGADSLEGGRDAAAELLSSGPPPTAIICVNDIMAVGVMKEVRERGLRIPEDVSITGFDNIKLSEFCCPPLTTVHIPRDLIGHTVFTSLVPDESGHAVEGREIVINPELVVRDSTGPAQRPPR